MCFDSIADIEDFARAFGASDKVEAICATARPTLLFSRENVPDDPLPVGATKFGGFPDLPADVAWPERPPWPDAHQMADELLQRADRRCSALTEQMNSLPVPGFSMPTRADIDAVIPKARNRCAVLFEPFPLAFIAQFNLEALAKLDGLDPDLPRSGLLSLFADITWEGHGGKHWVYWHDRPITEFVRVPVPRRLAAYYQVAIRHAWEQAWETRTTSALLHPVSTLTIPDHWQDQALDDALDVMAHFEAQQLDPSPPAPQSTFVRNDYERLGGWPATLQYQHPEDCIARRTGSGGVEVPGGTHWHNLFCGELPMGHGRFMHAEQGGGDMVYIMIHEDDLKARRFDATETVTIWD